MELLVPQALMEQLEHLAHKEQLVLLEQQECKDPMD